MKNWKRIAVILVAVMALTCLFSACSYEAFEYKLSDDKSYYTLVRMKTSIVSEVELPEKYSGKLIKAIGNNAFAGNTNLTSISLPASVESINDGAFKGCTNLKEITLPASVKSIGESAFEGCSSLTKITMGEDRKSVV